MAPFVIFALPRSRTAWMAHWLSYGRSDVGHDIGIVVDTPEQFLGCFSEGMVGTVETGAIIAHRLLRKHIPEAKFLTIRRDIGDVWDSLIQAQFPVNDATWQDLLQRDAMLDMLERSGDCESLHYLDLNSIHVRHWIWHHLRSDVGWDAEWDALCAVTNIQIDAKGRVAQLQARSEAISSLQTQIAIQTRELLVCPTLQ